MEPPPGRYSVPPRKDSSSSGIRTSPIDGILQRPPVPGSRRLSKEERKNRYDRIEMLTKELTYALKDEMSRRKDSWDADGDMEEEEHWENRKKEIYDGLSDLTAEIKRAMRDRNKEAVLNLWGKEMEERRVKRSGSLRRDGDEEVDGDRRIGGEGKDGIEAQIFNSVRPTVLLGEPQVPSPKALLRLPPPSSSPDSESTGFTELDCPPPQSVPCYRYLDIMLPRSTKSYHRAVSFSLACMVFDPRWLGVFFVW